MVQDGRKRTTIRFDERGLEYPSSSVLPLYVIEPGRPHGEATRVAEVLLTGVRYVRCSELSAADARADGFRSQDELVGVLKRFYPALKPESLVCIYSFEPSRSNAAGALEPRRKAFGNVAAESTCV